MTCYGTQAPYGPALRSYYTGGVRPTVTVRRRMGLPLEAYPQTSHLKAIGYLKKFPAVYKAFLPMVGFNGSETSLCPFLWLSEWL